MLARGDGGVIGERPLRQIRGGLGKVQSRETDRIGGRVNELNPWFSFTAGVGEPIEIFRQHFIDPKLRKRGERGFDRIDGAGSGQQGRVGGRRRPVASPRVILRGIDQLQRGAVSIRRLRPRELVVIVDGIDEFILIRAAGGAQQLEGFAAVIQAAGIFTRGNDRGAVSLRERRAVFNDYLEAVGGEQGAIGESKIDAIHTPIRQVERGGGGAIEDFKEFRIRFQRLGMILYFIDNHVVGGVLRSPGIRDGEAIRAARNRVAAQIEPGQRQVVAGLS